MNTFSTGKLTAVYSTVGKRSNGETRYRREGYDVLSWDAGGVDPETYIVPLGDRVSSGGANLNDAQFGMEFGFYDLQPLVIEPHVANGSQDTWASLHSFGYV